MKVSIGGSDPTFGCIDLLAPAFFCMDGLPFPLSDSKVDIAFRFLALVVALSKEEEGTTPLVEGEMLQ